MSQSFSTTIPERAFEIGKQRATPARSQAVSPPCGDIWTRTPIFNYQHASRHFTLVNKLLS